MLWFSILEEYDIFFSNRSTKSILSIYAKHCKTQTSHIYLSCQYLACLYFRTNIAC